GYIGGGNALVLFKDKDKATEFIKNYTKLLLVKVPGLKTAFGIIHDFDLDNFKNSMKNLHENLRENKNKYFPNVTLPKYGFTLDCPRTNESAENFKDPERAESFNEQDAKIKYISSVACTKLKSLETKLKSSDKAKDEMIDKKTKDIKDILNDKYTLTNDIEKLGQQEGKDYIAVVHIDGNKMGERFSKCESLSEYRKLSVGVKNATKNTFKKMIKILIEQIEKNKAFDLENGEFKLSKENGKTILPIRPIVLGGDDITFISDGRLGVWLAEIFINEFIKQSINNESLSACGGVSIVKTKYPFYRAYKLAEDLTDKAKKESREKEGSYIDFFISSSGWSGSLEDILNKHLSTVNGNLHFGPYRVDKTEEEKSLKNLKNIVKAFKKIPKNKVMKLREMLFEDEKIAKSFVKELEANKIKLPEIP
ncbi:MAG: Cas10/Cmr2 second palm domain-containing protein, partial [Candidatus Ratteibacteria bacterium]